MGYEAINYSMENGVAVVQFNRPEKMNVLEDKLVEEFEDIIYRLGKDEEVGAVILTGSGRAFSAGGDIGSMKEGFNTLQGREYLTRSHHWLLRFVQLEKPVIAAINGFAVGAGFCIAMLCDILIAEENAKFSQAFAGVGLVPDMGGMYYLPRLIGLPRAKELIFTGKQLTAQEAYDLGIVNKVVPPEKLLEESKDLAQSLADGPRVAIKLAKKILNFSPHITLEELLEYEAYAQAVCFQTEDHQEAAKAFFEKRKPVFKGR